MRAWWVGLSGTAPWGYSPLGNQNSVKFENSEKKNEVNLGSSFESHFTLMYWNNISHENIIVKIK